MHNFILGIFDFLKNILQFFKIVCVFCIIMITLYWIQNLIGAQWAWLGFMKPFLDSILAYANSIYSLSFDFFGATFELKYLSSVIILVLLTLTMTVIIFGLNFLEGLYKSAHFVYKKTEETLMNKKFENDITREEKRIQKYTVVINTQLKKKFAHQELNVDIEKHNKIMNDMIMAKTSVKPANYQGGYMYAFTNFDKVDTILDIMFKLIHSESPLDFSVCIQVGEQIKQLNKLIKLQNYGKITIAADTAYRYKFNETHRYQISTVGIFQLDDSTFEVHEFKEIL